MRPQPILPKKDRMPFDLLQFLIICPLSFVAGFIDAIAGGGGLISLPAYIIAGLPAHAAIATNKMSATMGTALTTVRFARSGYIPWRIAGFCLITAFVGSTTGARLTLMVSDFYLKAILLVLLPLIGVYVMRGKAFEAHGKELSRGKTIAIGMAVALVVGVYDGFYGPGTGTFLILLLSALAHMDITTANGTTKAINLATNVSALAVFLLHGQVLVVLGLVAGAFNIAGNYLGSRSFDKGGSKIVKPAMIIVIAVFFVRVVGELAGLW